MDQTSVAQYSTSLEISLVISTWLSGFWADPQAGIQVASYFPRGSRIAWFDSFMDRHADLWDLDTN